MFTLIGDKCALMLLKSGAGPNKATEDGMTPVHVAAKYGNLATMVLLLEDGGDPLKKTKVYHFTKYCFIKLRKELQLN